MSGREEYDDVMSEEVVDEPITEEEIPDGDDTNLEEQEDTVTLSQAKLDELIRRRLARERDKQNKEMEKRLAKQFGTADLAEASKLARAGRAVSKASGVTPDEVYNRILEDARAKGQTIDEEDIPMSDDMSTRIQRIEELLNARFTEEAMMTQEQQAKGEFGSLYDQYRDDILDKAEESGMDVMDAATLVLRPHLKTFYEERALKERQTRTRRQVDSTTEGASSSTTSYQDKLTADERRVAQRMGMSYKEYFENK
jgi:hypothetical protein